MSVVTIREFTDPRCPWAYSAEPSRWRLRWLFGDQIEWQSRMVVLSERPPTERFDANAYSEGLRGFVSRFGMPIDTRPRSHRPVTFAACLRVVAARLHGAAGEDAGLLRRLRIRCMMGEALDEPETVALAAREAGIDPAELERWAADGAVETALRADMAAARDPSTSALALDHKLADADTGPSGRRYTCPSYEIERADGGRVDLPGFQPLAAYEVALANVAPELERRPDPDSVEEALRWAGEPLASAEVAAVCGLEPAQARERLARVALEQPLGSDGYWTLAAGSTVSI